MGQPVYDEIGQSYHLTRSADSRIVAELVRLIAQNAGATVCDVGAGSGNYTNALADAGYRILAVEPSEIMRRQAPPDARVSWFEGRAEALPLPDAAVSAMVCTLAAHHFSDLGAALREMDRVCPAGPLVFFTFEPHRAEPQWFAEYFPEIVAKDYALFPSTGDFAAIAAQTTGRACEATAFPLPPDLTDQMMYAPWARPEKYLDPVFRANTSGFARADADIMARRLGRLADDLASGRWDARFGQFRTKASNDAGFVFVTLRR